MSCCVFLDLYGVLVDSRVMGAHYRRRMAEILDRRYGGGLVKWEKIHDDAWAWYTQEGARLDAMPPEGREGDAWIEATNGLEERWVQRVFELAGLPPPEDRVRFSRELESEIVRGIDALYPDVRPTLERIKAQGHRLFLSTNASRSNGENALVGGGIRDLFDGLVLLEVARAKKDRPFYWQRAFEVAAVRPNEAVIVDDVASYLRPAAELGARCIQLIRTGAERKRGPWPIIETLEALREHL